MESSLYFISFLTEQCTLNCSTQDKNCTLYLNQNYLTKIAKYPKVLKIYSKINTILLNWSKFKIYQSWTNLKKKFQLPASLPIEFNFKKFYLSLKLFNFITNLSLKLFNFITNLSLKLLNFITNVSLKLFNFITNLSLKLFNFITNLFVLHKVDHFGCRRAVHVKFIIYS